MKRGWYIVALCIGVWDLANAASVHAAPPPSPAEQVRFFETHIRPLFATHCFQCHGEKKQRADLRLDTREGLALGGLSGAPVVPGKPEKSLLLHAVSHRDPDLSMPPKEKLSDREIADLSHWIEMGAPYPDTKVVADNEDREGRNFWAFSPPGDPPVPVVRDETWPATPIDRFILARLEAQGLRPAPPANREMLLRRVTFDLIGLPPTPEQVKAFVEDPSPDAYAKVVDRLLASPAYGERWGRHWLDVARYADSNGLDENIAHGNAWRYRDYIVQSLNADKPFSRLVLEQLAGDLLPAATEAARNEQLIATGFLSLGPKVLAEVDEQKMEMDIIDEQISTVGRTFLGLTLGCARCHDHKFDPISQNDYYGLAGIFKSTKTMDSFTKIARWHENLLLTPQARTHQARVANLQKEIEDLKASRTAADKPSAMTLAAIDRRLKEKQVALKKLEQQADTLPSAMGVVEGTVANTSIHRRGSYRHLGAEVPRHFPEVLINNKTPAIPAGSSGRLELARWLLSPDHPLTARVMVNRLWRWHFGTGLVATPDNFGKLGKRPSHPALLDWLARRFQEKGWSIKEMHRLIVLSRTYQMSDVPLEGKDPDNRFYSHFPVRRLESEAIRDALLAVSGLLDRHMGGSLLQVDNRKFFFDHTSKDTTRYDSPRRSLYLPVVRNHLYAVFELFDSTDAAVPDGDRSTTTVAPQALFLLNSDLVLQASDTLARQLLQGEKTDTARLQQLYRRAYGREPTSREVSRLQRLLLLVSERLAGQEADPNQRREKSWALVCQVVLAANEFIYVR